MTGTSQAKQSWWAHAAPAVLEAIALALSTGSVGAIPPPLSPQELEKQSDVIATARVLAVTCTGFIENEKTKEAKQHGGAPA